MVGNNSSPYKECYSSEETKSPEGESFEDIITLYREADYGNDYVAESPNTKYEKYKELFPSQYVPSLTYSTKLAIINNCEESFRGSSKNVDKKSYVSERIKKLLKIGRKLDCFLYSIVDIDRRRSGKSKTLNIKEPDILKFTSVEIDVITNEYKAGTFNKLNAIEIKSLMNGLQKDYISNEIIYNISGFSSLHSYIVQNIRDRMNLIEIDLEGVKKYVKDYLLDSYSDHKLCIAKYQEYKKNFIPIRERVSNKVLSVKPLSSAYPDYEAYRGRNF